MDKGERGCMGQSETLAFFRLKIFFKSFLEKTKTSVSICPLFHIAPLSPARFLTNKNQVNSKIQYAVY
jgi:hypothetical protein